MTDQQSSFADPGYRDALAVLECLARVGDARPKAPMPTPEPDEPAAVRDAPVQTWSEQTLRTLIESLPDAMVVIGSHGTIVLVNAQTERIFGYAREEMLGRPIEMLIPNRFRRDHIGHRDSYFAMPRSRPMGARLELFGRRKDGTEFPVEISLSPLMTEQGVYATSVIRDISQRKRDEAKFRTLVENIPAVTFIAPLDESVPELYVSPQIEKLLGFSQKEWLEDPVLWHRQLHPEDAERWNRQFAPTCASGEPFNSIYRFIAKDGRVVWVHGSASVVRDADGKPSFLQGVAFDITSIKEAEEALREAEEALRQSNADLERRVKERTEELARAVAESQDKAKELEHFAEQASHDLSKPLLTLKMYLKDLGKDYLGKVDAQADDWINRIIAGADRLGRLITSLKQYARVVERDRASRPIDSTASAKDACANLLADIEECAAQVILGDLPMVLGDRDQLVFLFQNLIGNAIKFRDAQRPIRIEVGARPDPDGWQFWVRDNGIGIEKEFYTTRPKLFLLGAEARVAPTPAKYPGTGYGLHICKKIVTRHGGRIWVESEFGKGTTFFFTLPAVPDA